LSIIIITLGWHSRPIGGCSAELTQLDSPTPHYTRNKTKDSLISWRGRRIMEQYNKPYNVMDVVNYAGRRIS
jgi:hypothetical protein